MCYFIFTRVTPSETSPSLLYSSAEGIGTQVYPHWTPTLTSTQSTSMTTPREPRNRETEKQRKRDKVRLSLKKG